MVEMLFNKLVIGTANFGLDYGINNTRGKLKESVIVDILDFANKNGITDIDTAQFYGNAENRLSGVLKKLDGEFNIITKLKPFFTQNVTDLVTTSIKNLDTENLYGILYHNFKDFIDNKPSLEKIELLKSKGIVRKIGFSVYYPHEIEYLFAHNISFDIVQFPFNIFDQRFEYLFDDLKRQKIEIHVRSAFLQGMFFLNPDNLPELLQGAKSNLKQIGEISHKFDLSISSLCLNFIFHNDLINKIIIGVDSKEQLKQNMSDIQTNKYTEEVHNLLKGLEIKDENIILPTNWK